MVDRTTHPRRMPKCYAMMLCGSTDEEILDVGISQVDLQRIKKFHGMITSGSSYMSLVMIKGIDQCVVKRMWSMYHEFINGRNVISEPLRINTIFRLILEGYSYDELTKAGYVDSEIEKAEKMMDLARSDVKDRMLMSSISELMNLPKSSISHMLKCYREHTEGKIVGEEAERAYYPDKICAQISAA